MHPLPPHPDPRYDAHLAPTLADVPLEPRRRLRDGTASSGSSRRGSVSSRGSRTSYSRGVKRSRSTTESTEDSQGETSAYAEASRRLPALHPRLPRAQDNGYSGDEARETRRSTSLANAGVEEGRDVAEDEARPSSSRRETASPRHRDRAEVMVVSSDDESLFGLRSRSSPRPRASALSSQRQSVDHDLGEEGAGLDVKESTPRSPPLSTNDASNHAPDSHPDSLQPDSYLADSSFDSTLTTSDGSHPSHGSNRSPSPASSSTESSGPRRFTAQEKGKGRAISRPSVIEMSDEDAFDESIQFIDSKPAPPIDITDDDETMVEEEPPEAAIDEESSISAFSESTLTCSAPADLSVPCLLYGPNGPCDDWVVSPATPNVDSGRANIAAVTSCATDVSTSPWSPLLGAR